MILYSIRFSMIIGLEITQSESWMTGTRACASQINSISHRNICTSSRKRTRAAGFRTVTVKRSYQSICIPVYWHYPDPHKRRGAGSSQET